MATVDDLIAALPDLSQKVRANPFDQFDQPAANPFDRFDRSQRDVTQLSDAELQSRLVTALQTALGGQAPASSFSPEDLLRVAADAKRSGYQSFGVPKAGGGELTMTPQQAAGGAQTVPNVDAMIAALPDASKPVAQPGTNSARDFMAASMPMLGGAYLPDIAMGAGQVTGALGQLAARGVKAIAPNVGSDLTNWIEGGNKQALDFYNKTFRPESVPGSDLARGIGQTLVTAPALPARAITGGWQLAKAVGQGAGQGAAFGALTPVYDAGENFWQQKGEQAKQGTEAGLLTAGLVHAGGRLLSPNTSAQAQTLIDSGVSPTAGQILGGLSKSIEEKLTSVPLLGDAIKSAQRRGIDDFNRAIYQRTLAPLGPDALKVAQVAPVGNEGIAKVGNVLSDAYNEVLPKITVQLDSPFMQQATQLKSMTASLKPETATQFTNVLQNEVYNKFTAVGLMSGETMKNVESELGRLARGYKGDSAFDQRQLGTAIQQLQANLRSMVARGNPELAPRVQAINQGWANLTQLENAGSMLGAKEGIVSPAQFLNAVKRSDQSVRDRAFARGEARNQDLAQAGDAVLSSKYPDSGTAGRGLLAGGLGLLLGGGAAAVNPMLPAAGLLAMLPYTPWGQKITAGLLAKRPQILDQLGGLVQRAVPYLAAPAAQGLLGADH